MTKAEEAALKAYPEDISYSTVLERPFDYNGHQRMIFQQGYEQAEKDLALTVEGIKTILDLSFWNDDPEKILEEYQRICDTSNQTPR